MILIKYLNFIYKYITNNFNICIMRIAMAILINTIISILLKHFYNNIFFYIIFEENQGYPFIQKGFLCHTILKKGGQNMKEKSKKKRQMKKAIVVARSATSEPTAALSINAQLRWAKSRAKELDAAIYYMFSICGIGANSFFEAYSEKILDAIRQQRIDYLVVYGLDRLTRNLAQGTEFLNTIVELGCTIMTSTDIIDTESVLHMPDMELAFSEYNTKKNCKKKHLIGRM